jgi:hypothetical protein
MAEILITFEPHFVNAGSGDLVARVEGTKDWPVPDVPDHCTPGTEPGTVVANTLQVGDQAYVDATTILEVKAIDLSPTLP